MNTCGIIAVISVKLLYLFSTCGSTGEQYCTRTTLQRLAERKVSNAWHELRQYFLNQECHFWFAHDEIFFF